MNFHTRMRVFFSWASDLNAYQMIGDEEQQWTSVGPFKRDSCMKRGLCVMKDHDVNDEESMKKMGH